MRKIKEVLRLHYQAGLSRRSVAVALKISYGSAANYFNRALQAGITWPLPEGMGERSLARLLFPSQAAKGQRRFSEPDYPTVHQELKRKGVTKLPLWEEYRQQHPNDGYNYAQFCHRYQEWLGKQQRSMRQLHRAGEKLLVDYCGPTMSVINPDTGEVRQAQVFEFLGGVPELVVPV